MSDPNLEPEQPPASANPYHSPPIDTEVVAEMVHQPQEAIQGDSTGGVIPYKNPHALIAYYLGILALIPVIGVPFGLASVILGFMGLSRRKQNPVIKGSIHAWIGIVFGVLSMFCGGGILVAMIIGAAQS